MRFAGKNLPIPNLNPLDLAWMAGIIDGEGYLGIMDSHGRGKRNYYIAAVKVGNTSLRMVKRLNELWPGSMQIRPAGYLASRKTFFDWILRGKRAIEFVRAIRPYLVAKEDQADVILEFANLAPARRGRYGCSDKDLEVRRRMYDSLKLLKAADGLSVGG